MELRKNAADWVLYSETVSPPLRTCYFWWCILPILTTSLFVSLCKRLGESTFRNCCVASSERLSRRLLAEVGKLFMMCLPCSAQEPLHISTLDRSGVSAMCRVNWLDLNCKLGLVRAKCTGCAFTRVDYCWLLFYQWASSAWIEFPRGMSQRWIFTNEYTLPLPICYFITPEKKRCGQTIAK